jgi:hypothetical protein
MSAKPPKPIKIKFSIYLPPHLLAQAQAFAEADDRSLSYVVQRCVEVGLGEVMQGRAAWGMGAREVQREPASKAAREGAPEGEAAQPKEDPPHARTQREAAQDTAPRPGMGWREGDPTF